MANYYWRSASPGATANWGTTGAGCRWFTASGGGTQYSGPPTASDVAIFDANSGTGTCNLPGGYAASCFSLLCRGLLSNSNTSITITGGPNSVINVSGSVVLSPDGNLDLRLYPTINMIGSGTINTNGNTFGNLNINTSGAIFLLDDLIGVGNATLILTMGLFDANGHNVTFGKFYSSAAGDPFRTLLMGSGLWTMTFEGTYLGGEYAWDIGDGSNLTFDTGTADIRLVPSANSYTTSVSLISGLRADITSDTDTSPIAFTVDPVSFPPSGYIMIGEELIYYVGVDATTRYIGTATISRGMEGTVASTHSAGAAIIGMILQNSALTTSLDAASTAPISVYDAQNFPTTDGVVQIDNELIQYVGTSLSPPLIGTTSVTRGYGSTLPTSHSAYSNVVFIGERLFNGGGLTYNNLIVGNYGYITKNYITGSSTFKNITNLAGVGDGRVGIFRGIQELYFQGGTTTTLQNPLAFTGTDQYLQKIATDASGTTAFLRPYPVTDTWQGWYVGANSIDGGNNTGLYFVPGVTNYIYWKDIVGTVTVAITGLQMTTYLNSVATHYNWESIDDAQGAVWTPITD